jgi:hypothetical protein
MSSTTSKMSLQSYEFKMYSRVAKQQKKVAKQQKKLQNSKKNYENKKIYFFTGEKISTNLYKSLHVSTNP